MVWHTQIDKVFFQKEATHVAKVANSRQREANEARKSLSEAG